MLLSITRWKYMFFEISETRKLRDTRMHVHAESRMRRRKCGTKGGRTIFKSCGYKCTCIFKMWRGYESNVTL